MKKYLSWRNIEEMEGPKVACPAPVFPRSFTNFSSPCIDTTNSLLSGFGGPSAFSVFSSIGSPELPKPSPIIPTATLPQSTLCSTPLPQSPFNQALSPENTLLYNQLMCLPALLGPNILRSHHMATTQFKPIPNSERVDLAGWSVKEPSDWGMDDVAGWMLDLSKRHRIPCEDINMIKFATLKGADLLRMTEDEFKRCDPNFGALFYKEMRTLVGVGNDDNMLDDVLRKYKESEEENQTYQLQKQLQKHQQQMQNSIFAAQQITQSIANNIQAQSFAQNLANNLCAALSPSVNGLGLGNTLSPNSPLLHHHLQQKLSPVSHDYLHCFQPGPSTSNNEYDSDIDVKTGLHKVRDGKMRKRSQHTKGNKLWEFIRDALKDPATCPSVVRWEDPVEGVFRIVESEKLARLWGERKNNQKMTYEKLSRAMRTYYDKQILVPVPKTGLYPKKLVYKFGPGAIGWMIKQEMATA